VTQPADADLIPCVDVPTPRERVDGGDLILVLS